MSLYALFVAIHSILIHDKSAPVVLGTSCVDNAYEADLTPKPGTIRIAGTLMIVLNVSVGNTSLEQKALDMTLACTSSYADRVVVSDLNLDAWLRCQDARFFSQVNYLWILAAGFMLQDVIDYSSAVVKGLNKLKRYEAGAMGHIMHRKQKRFLPYLHEQMLLLDLAKWKDTGLQPFGPVYNRNKAQMRFPAYIVSNKTIHDDYTPLWLRVDPRGPRYGHMRVGELQWGTQVLAGFIEHGLPILNLPLYLRKNSDRTFLYPIHSVIGHNDAWRKWKNVERMQKRSIDITRFEKSYRLSFPMCTMLRLMSRMPFNAKTLSIPTLLRPPLNYFGTTENPKHMSEIIHRLRNEARVSSDVEALVTVAGGGAGFHLLQHLRPRVLGVFDYMPSQLIFIYILQALVFANSHITDFFSSFFTRDIEAWKMTSGVNLDAATQHQYLQVPPSFDVINKTLNKLAAPPSPIRMLYTNYVVERMQDVVVRCTSEKPHCAKAKYMNGKYVHKVPIRPVFDGRPSHQSMLFGIGSFLDQYAYSRMRSRMQVPTFYSEFDLNSPSMLAFMPINWATDKDVVVFISNADNYPSFIPSMGLIEAGIQNMLIRASPTAAGRLILVSNERAVIIGRSGVVARFGASLREIVDAGHPQPRLKRYSEHWPVGNDMDNS